MIKKMLLQDAIIIKLEPKNRFTLMFHYIGIYSAFIRIIYVYDKILLLKVTIEYNHLLYQSEIGY